MGLIILLLWVRDFGYGPWELSVTVSKECRCCCSSYNPSWTLAAWLCLPPALVQTPTDWRQHCVLGFWPAPPGLLFGSISELWSVWGSGLLLLTGHPAWACTWNACLPAFWELLPGNTGPPAPQWHTGRTDFSLMERSAAQSSHSSIPAAPSLHPCAALYQQLLPFPGIEVRSDWSRKQDLCWQWQCFMKMELAETGIDPFIHSLTHSTCRVFTERVLCTPC